MLLRKVKRQINVSLFECGKDKRGCFVIHKVPALNANLKRRCFSNMLKMLICSSMSLLLIILLFNKKLRKPLTNKIQTAMITKSIHLLKTKK